MLKTVIQIEPRDNVAVALRPLTPGETIAAGGKEIVVKDHVPAGHKVALAALAAGDGVIKYGRPIGLATAPVSEGAWVHSHNLKTALTGTRTYEFRAAARPPEPERLPGSAPFAGPAPTFWGYRRAGGRVGTRNELWILPTVGCVNATALRLAALANQRFSGDNFDGAFAFPHPHGCSQLGDDLENTKKILAALMRHPNAGGVLVLGLGCETLQHELLTGGDAGLDITRVRAFEAQSVVDETETGLRALAELFEVSRLDRREEVPASELVLGVKCGGSDGFSGITANPLVGRVADWATSLGATVLLSEVPEIFGAEGSLMDRARDKAVFDRVASLIDGFKRYYLDNGQPVYENPSPGNKAGGITTLEEKSLGAVEKGGRALVTQVLDYGERASERGLVLVSSPGNDMVSSTALAASGATLLLFTTGRGTPLAGPVPTLKISSHTDLVRKKPGWIDFDAGRLLQADQSLEAAAAGLVRLVVEVASGKKRTTSETHGPKDIAIWKTGVTL